MVVVLYRSSLKLHVLHLKIGGWKMMRLPLGGVRSAYFQGRLLLVSGRVTGTTNFLLASFTRSPIIMVHRKWQDD